MTSQPLEVRCTFCSRRPLLAICGRDTVSGEPYVHVKTWKANRLYAEVIATSGTVRIRCRECLRWHKITIRIANVEIKSEKLPDSIVV